TFVFTGQKIKFGNYTCLPKIIVNNMVNEAATWSSFSGALVKIIDNRNSISSIRGTRYFNPSKMSFLNLLKHSLSIIAVFKKTLIARSIIFLLVYFFLIYGSLSIITLIPVFFIFILIYSVVSLSKRENLEELNNSLNNIDNIEEIN
ncbi:MAG: glycosyl transferase, partial [Candidatus Pelagibacter sp.]|nr:glycosyl transferase [Candidatus Pelagibacter sp.]